MNSQIVFNNNNYQYSITDTVIHITDSYKCKKIKDIKELLNLIKYNNISLVFLNRTNSSLINEWCAHNLLYQLGISRSRTKDVDMEYPQKWYYKLGYKALYIIYWLYDKLIYSSK